MSGADEVRTDGIMSLWCIMKVIQTRLSYNTGFRLHSEAFCGLVSSRTDPACIWLPFHVIVKFGICISHRSFTCVCDQPLLQNAGKDISHWFEPRTFQTDMLEVLMWFHPTMRIHTYYCPQVQSLHQMLWTSSFLQIFVVIEAGFALGCTPFSISWWMIQ